MYAKAGEIFNYFHDFASKYSLHQYVKLRHLVTSATWNTTADVWDLEITDLTTGEIIHDQADIFINASGVLNHWKWPDIAGLKDFKGVLLHTANYDPSVDLAGKYVGLIGNG